MVTEYVCEVTGRKYKTKRGAENSAKRERLLDWQRNYFRLNATSVEHLVELMVEKGREFWGWGFDVSDLKHNGSFISSCGKTIVKFSMGLKLTPGKRHNKHSLIGEYVLYHVSGLEASFNWKSFRCQKITGSPCNLNFSLNLDDFPLIREKYITYCHSVSDHIEWEKEKSVVELEAHRFSRKQDDFKEVSKRVAILECQLDIAKNTKNEILSYYLGGYKKLWEDKVPEPVIDGKLDKMFRKKP